uniref:Growth-regulating factor n=1 Tax=Chenopodium quinoa TaxID=63459 RepID=A0A803L2C9_CHEQI
MGFPFTATQWKELERQAMIYKYMMASLPVPPDLLYSSFPTNFSYPSTFSPASYYMGKYGSGISMRWSGNSKDAEPGRCRRTDGKKWRNLGWNDEQQWNQLVQTNMNSSVFQQQFEGEPLNLNSQSGHNPTKSDELGLLERPLFDAWSIGMAGNNKNNGSSKLSLSSSNGGNSNVIDDEMCQIHMGLGLIDSWVSSSTTPGGPLAEVLRPGNMALSDVSEVEFVTPPATAVSSPSGVLQKTLATFSDSSESNSPTTTTCHNSKANSDMPFHWLN